MEIAELLKQLDVNRKRLLDYFDSHRTQVFSVDDISELIDKAFKSEEKKPSISAIATSLFNLAKQGEIQRRRFKGKFYYGHSEAVSKIPEVKIKKRHKRKAKLKQGV